ncbi:hypothetical protein [Novosphingobium silvae]|uniref:oxidoreductase n=1 Tax=Novosphingobium silvae TaxID=2692619 RepID=UPI0019269DC6|nr:hypothetical protein [Novosphingobium silvae]
MSHVDPDRERIAALQSITRDATIRMLDLSQISGFKSDNEVLDHMRGFPNYAVTMGRSLKGNYMSALFSPFDLGPVPLTNRIVASPMCQYSADDGSATDWHHQHLPSYGMSGAALVMTEATHVERRGRITHGCLGLYSDTNERLEK